MKLAKETKNMQFFQPDRVPQNHFFYFMSRNLSITEGWQFGPGLTLVLPFFLKATYR